ncbi:ommochrome-binding protein-like [Aricia agestis]|uniref:ommochrome-binding protein-like n=1 Tax=Aricia agestis TaxID=91739 RepID=UPI001C20B759|nr:ommochrome-binding protein-like [Aricia agestis]
MIKLLLLAAVFAAAQGRVVENCDGVIVHNIKHDQEVLHKFDSPYQLAIDYDTNTLFFSYSTNSDDEVFKSAYINLKTNEVGIIPGIAGGFANAVDSQKHKVYLGGRDGVYNFNFDSKKAEHIDGANHNIWQLFYKDDLYYTSYPDEVAYVYKNGVSQRVPELTDTQAMLIAIDNDKNIYFSNSSGLFLHKKSKQYTVNVGDYNLNSFTADSNGNLYFSTAEGIYNIKDDKKVEKLTSIDNIYGVAVEADGNIIYASQSALIRLKPTKQYCFKDEKIL